MNMGVNARSLIGKLNDTVRGVLENAVGFALSQTHYDVEIEHFLMKLLDAGASDLECIVRYFEIDRTRLTKELSRSLDGFKRGNGRNPSISQNVYKMIIEAWTIGSI